MITRSWTCLNKNCRHEFDAGNDNPKCPKCGNLRTQWLPRPVALGGQASQIDRVVRGLAEDFRMTDVPTVRRGQSVKGNGPTGPGPRAKVGGMDIPIDRVHSYNTKTKVGGNPGSQFGRVGSEMLRSRTAVVAKAEK